MGTSSRIMVNAANAVETAATAAAAVPLRTQAFTAEQLQTAWRGYIEQHPQERALCTTMSYSLPQPGADSEHYVMMVGSPAEQKHVEEHKGALLQFLRDALQNDRMDLDVKVSETPMNTPKIMSPREVVEQIKEHNPRFTQFIKDFDLGLA